MRLMNAAHKKAFDVIIVEALDRLSRDQENLAGIWKRLQFLGIEIRAVHEGKGRRHPSRRARPSRRPLSPRLSA
jgi:DNA invertase Pin-like site-specific DNA recombinase